MAAVFRSFGASGVAGAPALLLLAALLAGAADAARHYITTEECRAGNPYIRVRGNGIDSVATYLLMRNCSLTEINPLIGLPNLEHANYDYNNISDINLAALRTVPTLRHLWLSRNSLREVPVFDKRSCPSLTGLHLPDNKLTRIINADTFAACIKLESISLHNNRIEYIHADVFSSLPELKNLYLYNNRLTFIPARMFVMNTKLHDLRLDNNRITHMPFDIASRLKQAGAILELFDFSNNPWLCACLLELLVDVKRAGVPYERRYDGRGPVCVYSGAVPCHRAAPTGLLRPARGGR